MTERQELGSLEAMLFAHAEPVETARLADALRLDTDETTELLQKLQKRLDEQESGMVLLFFEPDRWQMTTRPYYGEMVKRILDTRRNAPLSPAALEVLAVIAYNQPVSRSFIEQVRGVDSSSTVTKLLDKSSRPAVSSCRASRSPFRSQTPSCACLGWAASMTCRRCTARCRRSPPPKPTAMPSSWNGSDCRWLFSCLSCG